MNLSKNGILTHHYVFNYGAYLQTYAQSKLLNTEIIDYRFKNTYDAQNTGTKRANMFLNSINKEMFLSEKKLISMNYQESLDFIKDYSKIIVGSDEIWKIGSDKTYKKPYPNIHWLHPDLKCKKIAMAASANRLNYNILDLETLKDMGNKLSAFDFLAHVP
jgi:hypothetical protein